MIGRVAWDRDHTREELHDLTRTHRRFPGEDTTLCGLRIPPMGRVREGTLDCRRCEATANRYAPVVRG